MHLLHNLPWWPYTIPTLSYSQLFFQTLSVFERKHPTAKKKKPRQLKSLFWKHWWSEVILKPSANVSGLRIFFWIKVYECSMPQLNRIQQNKSFFSPFMFQGILEGPMFWKSHFTVFQKNASSLSSFTLCVCLTFLESVCKTKTNSFGNQSS